MTTLNNPELLNSSCEACRIDAPKVTEQQAASLHAQIPLWQRVKIDGIDQLQREYSFADFAQALHFTNQIGDIAEREGHHPALLTEWGKVTVSWWSHKIKGLHRNDFIMAAKTDSVYT